MIACTFLYVFECSGEMVSAKSSHGVMIPKNATPPPPRLKVKYWEKGTSEWVLILTMTVFEPGGRLPYFGVFLYRIRSDRFHSKAIEATSPNVYSFRRSDKYFLRRENTKNVTFSLDFFPIWGGSNFQTARLSKELIKEFFSEHHLSNGVYETRM